MLTKHSSTGDPLSGLRQAIAAPLRPELLVWEFDYGIDVTVHAVERTTAGIPSRASISTFRPRVPSDRRYMEDEVLRYDLAVKTYNDLRCTELDTPRILVVMLLPEAGRCNGMDRNDGGGTDAAPLCLLALPERLGCDTTTRKPFGYRFPVRIAFRLKRDAGTRATSPRGGGYGRDTV